MKILALEFSAGERSVAIAHRADDGTFEMVASVHETDFRGVTGLAMIDRALQQAGWGPDKIGLVAVGLGPGSYTGIRSAIAIAQGWQLGRGVKLVGISSVLCLAHDARLAGMRGNVSMIIDAQRSELYVARYHIEQEQVREVAALQILARPDVSGEEAVIGPEAAKFHPGARAMAPSAATLATLAAEGASELRGEELEPIYLRATSFVKAPPPREVP